MPASKSTLRGRQLTPLQEFFNRGNLCFTERMPPIRDANLRERAKNCIYRSDNNNDLLEFIGDRAINLFAAVFVGEPQRRLGNAHHQLVASLVSNNDTLGRVAYYLHLYRDASLEPVDQRAIDKWHPFLACPPPKVLADLFEAHVGAILLDQGRDALYRWLRKLFEPIVKAATGDVFNNASAERIFGNARLWRPDEVRAEDIDELESCLCESRRRRTVRELGQAALKKLPPEARFRVDRQHELLAPYSGHTQVATHLINMWVCEIVLEAEPQYHRAVAKTAHLFTNITSLVTAAETLANVAAIAYLDDYCVPHSGPVTDSHCAAALKAMIGYLYAQDPAEADAWGKEWLTPVVLGAHDILTERVHFQPVIPASPRHTSKKAGRARPRTEKDDDALALLIKGVGAIDIKSRTAGSRRVVLKAADGTALADVFAALTVSPQKTDQPKQSKWKPIGRADSTKHDSRKTAPSHESCPRSAVREHNKENARVHGDEADTSDKGKTLGNKKQPYDARHGKEGPRLVDSSASLGPRTTRVTAKTARGPTAPRASSR